MTKDINNVKTKIQFSFLKWALGAAVVLYSCLLTAYVAPRYLYVVQSTEKIELIMFPDSSFFQPTGHPNFEVEPHSFPFSFDIAGNILRTFSDLP